jgi:hypothetical protein
MAGYGRTRDRGAPGRNGPGRSPAPLLNPASRQKGLAHVAPDTVRSRDGTAGVAAGFWTPRWSDPEKPHPSFLTGGSWWYRMAAPPIGQKVGPDPFWFREKAQCVRHCGWPGGGMCQQTHPKCESRTVAEIPSPDASSFHPRFGIGESVISVGRGLSFSFAC